uniref:Leucine-rich repeat protein (LRRP) n=1 Tax=Trypanosoma vivax (strain Y486) TaxID=1055687 RepID=G0UA76_TRYVY|nr:conserved hypothetical protein, fragment [Trypanosoma vivax Y486]
MSDIEEAEEIQPLDPLVAYEEVAPAKTKQQLIEEQLSELEKYAFEGTDEFPTHSVAKGFCEGKESLDVSYFSIGRKGSIALAAALRVNLSIKKLTLVNNSITPLGAMEIARALSETKTVVHLDLGQNLLGIRCPGEDIRGGAVITELLKTGNVLKSLSLRDNKLTDQHVAEFAEAAIDNTELGYLDLSFNCIGYLGAVELANIISRNADLQEVNLEWNPFQTIGSHHILGEGLLLNNTIKRFNLSWDGLDDACAQLVGRIISENYIEEIVIAHNRIGPAGAEHIAKGLLNSSALATLILDDNPLQSEGCAALLRVVGDASTLRQLGLQQCRCGPEIVEEANRIRREVRPDVDVIVSDGYFTN